MTAMRKSIQEQRTSRITVRFTEKEREFLTSEAETCGLTISTFVRRRSLGSRVTPKSDLRVISELLRLGGLLKHIHNETKGAYSALTSNCLREITACISRTNAQTDKTDKNGAAGQ
jgi:hypothetical protein